MSSIGSPIAASLLQAAQAQQAAAKARDRERAMTDSGQRHLDLVDLRVAGVEQADAARHLPHSDSEEAEAESKRDGGATRHHDESKDESEDESEGEGERAPIDVQA